MKKEKEEIPIFSLSETPSLMSADRMVNSTDNELFSFKDSTSAEEQNVVVILPQFEKEKKENKD